LNRGAVAIGVCSGLILAGCGNGGHSPQAAQTQPRAGSTTAATTATTTRSGASKSHTPGAAPHRPSRGEQAPGGAGDEQRAVVPVTFVVRAGAVAPATVSVPAFLAIRLTVSVRDARAHVVTLETSPVRHLLVAPGRGRPLDLDGLRPGRYAVRVSGIARPATIVAGVEPGP
jgi:hypothetical protein